MEIFIDTANLIEIKAAKKWGIVSGITTNPSLIKKEVERLKAKGEQVDMEGHIKSILETAGANCPVSLEVISDQAEGMVKEAQILWQKFNGVAGNVVIKVPVNPDMGKGNFYDGLRVIKTLEDAEIPVNCTLIFTPEQALLAAQAGASYVSPFAGRIDDLLRDSVEMEYQKTDYFPAEGEETADDEEDMEDNGILSGVDLVAKIADLFEKHEIDCNVLAASLRNPRQVREVALAGADVATVPIRVLKDMLFHVKTLEGMKKFTADVVPEYQQMLGGSGQATQVVPTQPSTPGQERPQESPRSNPTPNPQPERPNTAPSAHDLVN